MLERERQRKRTGEIYLSVVRSQSDFLHFDFAGNVEGHNIVDGKVE
jgi:hypothetical protein